MDMVIVALSLKAIFVIFLVSIMSTLVERNFAFHRFLGNFYL